MGVTKRVYADRCELARYNYRRTAGISALDMVMTIMMMLIMMMRVIMMMMTGVGGRHPGLAEHHVACQSGPQQGRQGLRVHRGGGEA